MFSKKPIKLKRFYYMNKETGELVTAPQISKDSLKIAKNQGYEAYLKFMDLFVRTDDFFYE